MSKACWDYTVVEYATTGISMDGAWASYPLQMNHCEIRDMSVAGLSLTDSSPVVDGLVVKDFGTYGIYATGRQYVGGFKERHSQSDEGAVSGYGQWPLF